MEVVPDADGLNKRGIRISTWLNQKHYRNHQVSSKDKPSSAKLKKKPSKQISVAEIRALNDVVNMSSHRNGYKIVIINPAEAMNSCSC